MIGLREDQQEGAQLAARIVTFLTTTIAHCGKPLSHWLGVNVRSAAGSAASKAAG